MIINGHTWRKWNTHQNRYTYCYAFGDLHFYHAINNEHTNKLLATIESAGPKRETLVLVEDVGHDVNSEHPLAKTFHEYSTKYYRTQHSPSPLLSLVKCCEQRSIPAQNVDTRLLHQIAAFFLITRHQCSDIETLKQKIETFCGPQPAEIFDVATIDEATSKFFRFYNLTVGSVATEISNSLEKIANYDDGTVLNTYYAKITALIHERMRVTFGKPLHELVHNEQTIFECYLSLPTPELQKDFMYHKLLLCNAELVDAQTLHAIQGSQATVHKVFLIMGAAHVASIEAVLEHLGYERISMYGPAMTTFEQAWIKDTPKVYYSVPATTFDKISNATTFDLKHKIRAFYKKATSFLR